MKNDSENTEVAKGGKIMGPMAQNENSSKSTDGASGKSGTSGSTKNKDSSGEDSADAAKQGRMMPPGMNCDESDESCEMPELPEDFDGEMQGDFGGSRGGRGEFMMQEGNTNSGTWHPAAYLSIGAGSVIIGILISYACFSSFFHKNPGRTFNTLNKFIWFIVAALGIAALICILFYFIPTWVK